MAATTLHHPSRSPQTISAFLERQTQLHEARSQWREEQRLQRQKTEAIELRRGRYGPRLCPRTLAPAAGPLQPPRVPSWPPQAGAAARPLRPAAIGLRAPFPDATLKPDPAGLRSDGSVGDVAATPPQAEPESCGVAFRPARQPVSEDWSLGPG